MAELKTKATKASVQAFINAIEDEERRKECRELHKMMRAITGKKSQMWGSSIVGFGNYHYKYKSGRDGNWFITGFSPRKQALTVYIMPGFSRYPSLMKRLGKFKLGASCLYLKRLDDVDRDVLHSLIEQSVGDMHEIYECGGGPA